MFTATLDDFLRNISYSFFFKSFLFFTICSFSLQMNWFLHIWDMRVQCNIYLHWVQRSWNLHNFTKFIRMIFIVIIIIFWDINLNRLFFIFKIIFIRLFFKLLTILKLWNYCLWCFRPFMTIKGLIRLLISLFVINLLN